jgi:hypothetical protein
MSISLAISRRNSSVIPPFRAAILLSGEEVSKPQPSFKNFDAFATVMGCSQSPGLLRLECLRNVPASTIHDYLNKNPFDSFTPQVDK